MTASTRKTVWRIEGMRPMTGTDDLRWVLWSLIGHHTPCSMDSKLNLRSCRGTCFLSCPADQRSETKKTMKKQYMVFITMMNVFMIWKKKAKGKTSIGFKVNLISFDIFSGGHISKLSKARKGFLYTTLCIYMLRVWVTSVTSRKKTEVNTSFFQ